MQRPANTKPRPTSLNSPAPTVIAIVLFFVLFFLYVWQRLQPAVGYYHSGPFFFLTPSFRQPFLGYPGGLLDYGAAFLTQLNRYNWLGALLFSGLGGLLFLATRWTVQRLGGGTLSIPALTPTFLLLLLLDRKDCPVLAISLGLLLALGVALLYLSLPGTAIGLRLGVSWLLSALLFYVAGAWPCLLSLSLIVPFEMLRRRNWWLGLGCGSSTLVVVAWLVLSHSTPSSKLLLPWGSGMPLLLAAALYLFCPLAALMPAFFQSTPAPTPSPSQAQRPNSPKAVPQPRQSVGLKYGLAACFWLIGWTLVWFGFDAPSRASAQIDYHAGRGEFAKVLAVAADPRVKTLDAASEIQLQRALFHTGRLCEDLFTYTNQTLWDVLPSLSAGISACRPQSETLFELGLVSAAEHLAHEALEFEGDRPDLLHRLACVNVLKDRPRAARVFANVLSQIPFERPEAAAFLGALEQDPRLACNPQLADVRSRMLTNDLPYESLPVEALLKQLLLTNPKNQMAYEYLMAYYLMAPDLKQLVDRLWQLDNFAYANIPRHCEEALLLYQQLKGVQVELKGRKIRAETRQRFQRFVEAMGQQRYRTPEGRAAMTQALGDTFWYYYFTTQDREKTADGKPSAP